MSLPRLLMLDEPSLGLAPIIVREIFAILKRINQAGTTILLVEQDVVHALALSHRGYVLENGSIVLHGSGGELLMNTDLIFDSGYLNDDLLKMRTYRDLRVEPKGGIIGVANGYYSNPNFIKQLGKVSEAIMDGNYWHNPTSDFAKLG